MKVSKTENRFKTGFQQPKTGFPKNPVLTSLIWRILKTPLAEPSRNLRSQCMLVDLCCDLVHIWATCFVRLFPARGSSTMMNSEESETMLTKDAMSIANRGRWNQKHLTVCLFVNYLT